MYKIKSFYNKNRKLIWKVIGGVVLLIVVLQVLNAYSISKMQLTEIEEDINTQNESEDGVISNEENAPTKAETETQYEIMSTEERLIYQFLENCKMNDIDEAYSLLTNECKDRMYLNRDIFKNSYVDKLYLNEKSSFVISKFSESIYAVEIIGDIMSTGNTSKRINEYITVEENQKLNINSYVGRTMVSNENNVNGLSIINTYIDTYMEYQTYSFSISNNSGEIVYLSDLSSNSSLYVQDSEDNIYEALMYQLDINDMIIYAGETKNIEITYNTGYDANKKMEKIVFSGVKINLEEKEFTISM